MKLDQPVVGYHIEGPTLSDEIDDRGTLLAFLRHFG